MTHAMLEAPVPAKTAVFRPFLHLSAWRTRRDTVNALARLSERELRDIGIIRHDIGRLGDEAARAVLGRG